jgi:hypothetical protein
LPPPFFFPASVLKIFFGELIPGKGGQIVSSAYAELQIHAWGWEPCLL